MKYNPDAYSAYPVLRPNSSDFPDGELGTSFKHHLTGNLLRIELTFRVNEPSILKHIEKGNAVCCAIVYCTATCYSEMLKADRGAISIISSVPINSLYGKVELHPSIITLDDIVINTDTIHQEYGNKPIPIAKGRRLAMDEPYHFAVGYVGAVVSIFQLEQDDSDKLGDWEFDVIAEPAERFIIIRANSTTFKLFHALPQVSLKAATVYLNALTTALLELNPDVPEENEHPEGWASCVRAHISKRDLKWPPHCSYALLAQRLLDQPLVYLSKT